MARSVTFLQLAPEFGGTKFGPFESVEIRLGSDPGSNDITLPETLGVASQHVKLLRQQDNTFILAPVDRAAPIFHFRSGTARSKQVTAPLAVQGGDSFALVTPEGPRFVIVVESDPRAIKAASEEAVGGPDWAKRMQPTASKMGKGLWTEVKRRGFAAVFTTRLGNLFMRASTMIRTGAIFSPIYIVSGMLMFSGWLFAGGAACSAFRLNTSKSTIGTQLSTCKDQLGVAQDDAGGDLTDPSVADLTRVVLEDANWKYTVDDDKDLYTAYADGLRQVYSEPMKYRWVYTQKSSPFTRFSASLESTGVPDPLLRVLAYAAAGPIYERTWSLVNDSEGKEVCGRGVLGLTYRQAYNLGLSTLQPDALVEPQVADSGDIALQRAALDATVLEAGTSYEYRDDMIQSVGIEQQGGLVCLYVDGVDERDDLAAVAKAVQRKIGSSGKNLPGIDEIHGIGARLVMLYAHEFKVRELEKLSFTAQMAPSIAMSTKDVKPERRAFAITEAARLMARAAAIPCLARFDKEQREVPSWFMAEPPKLGSCAILRAYVEYDRL